MRRRMEQVQANDFDLVRIRLLPDHRMSPADAAKFLGYSSQTLANWRCDGKGPKWMRKGGRIFYVLEDLQDWIANE
jgi:hypothetical protein